MAANSRLLWKIHSWLGLYTGIFIAFLSITGAAVVFKDEIDVLYDLHLYKVEEEGRRFSYSQLYQKLQNHVDQYDSSLRISAIGLPQQADEAFYISCAKAPVADAGLWQKAQGYQYMQFFINPYTGEILGHRDYYKSLSFFLRNLHVRFFDNYFGRPAAGIFGIALVVSTIIGFMIYGHFMKKAAVFAIRRKNYRQLYADWHKLVGVLSLFFNLMIAITGAWLGMQGYYMKWFAIENPGVFIREKVISPQQDKHLSFDIDHILSQTAVEFPALVPTAIYPSSDGQRKVEVVGNIPSLVYEINRHKMVWDKVSYQPLFKFNIHQQDFGTKLYMVQEALHFGNFGGFLLKLFYVFLGLASGFLSITGYYIYLKRKKSHFKWAARTIILLYAGLIVLIYTGVAIGHFAVGANVISLLFVIFLYSLLLILIIYQILKYKQKRLLSPAAPKTHQDIHEKVNS